MHASDNPYSQAVQHPLLSISAFAPVSPHTVPSFPALSIIDLFIVVQQDNNAQCVFLSVFVSAESIMSVWN